LISKSRAQEVLRSKTARETFEKRDEKFREETLFLNQFERRKNDGSPWWQVTNDNTLTDH